MGRYYRGTVLRLAKKYIKKYSLRAIWEFRLSVLPVNDEIPRQQHSSPPARIRPEPQFDGNCIRPIPASERYAATFEKGKALMHIL